MSSEQFKLNDELLNKLDVCTLMLYLVQFMQKLKNLIY